MPIEIKELVIRAVVDEQAGDGNGPEASRSSEDTTAIVKACVRQVLAILKKSKER